jgi:hypothetical protein
MSQDNQLPAPLDLPENPIPQDYGLPTNPTPQQLATWDRQQRFLDALAKYGSYPGACMETGVSIATVDYWVNKDYQGFKKRVEQARLLALGYGEMELWRRVHEGYQVPVIHRGEIRDWYQKKEATDLYFMLKKLDPAYKDNYQPQAAQQTNVQVNVHYPEGYTPGQPRQQPPQDTQLPADVVVEGEAWEIPDDGES